MKTFKSFILTILLVTVIFLFTILVVSAVYFKAAEPLIIQGTEAINEITENYNNYSID